MTLKEKKTQWIFYFDLHFVPSSVSGVMNTTSATAAEIENILSQHEFLISNSAISVNNKYTCRDLSLTEIDPESKSSSFIVLTSTFQSLVKIFHVLLKTVTIVK